MIFPASTKIACRFSRITDSVVLDVAVRGSRAARAPAPAGTGNGVKTSAHGARPSGELRIVLACRGPSKPKGFLAAPITARVYESNRLTGEQSGDTRSQAEPCATGASDPSSLSTPQTARVEDRERSAKKARAEKESRTRH